MKLTDDAIAKRTEIAVRSMLRRASSEPMEPARLVDEARIDSGLPRGACELVMASLINSGEIYINREMMAEAGRSALAEGEQP